MAAGQARGDVIRTMQDVLERERRGLIASVLALTAEFDDIVAGFGGDNADDEHDPEGSTIAYERARVSALLTSARSHLMEIDDALVRVDKGSYGDCVSCGAEIQAERLAAHPVARRCVGCPAVRPTSLAHRGPSAQGDR